MKIAFVSPYPPSHVTLNEYGYHLIKSFTGKTEVEKLYVLTNHLNHDDAYAQYGLPAIDIIPCWSFNNPLNAFKILHQLRRLHVDVVIMNLQFMTFGDRKIPAALGLLLPFLCTLYKIPSIVILHNITETVKLDTIGMAQNKWKEKIYRYIGKILTRFILKADLVGLTITQYVDIIRDKYKATNVVLLPHGNFELPPRNYLPDNISTYDIMTFGKFGTYKKVEVMIDAVELLKKQYPQYHFVTTIAGTDNPNVKGYLDGVKAKYNYIDDLVFTGYVPEEKVEELFTNSAFIVFPYTTTTGSSGILHQAGSYARACILPDIDDLKRVVEQEHYAGAYFEPEDPQSLAAAIASLIDDPQKRRQIEDQNYEAAKGLPMNELAEWYLSHAKMLLQKNHR